MDNRPYLKKRRRSRSRSRSLSTSQSSLSTSQSRSQSTSQSRSRSRSRAKTRKKRDYTNSNAQITTTRSLTSQTSKIIHQVCNTIGVQLCLSLSRYRIDILNLFDNFIFFNNLIGNAIRVGVVSVNGFVRKLTYKVRDITTYAILKSSASETSDNLAYEYIVGLFINRYCSIFPCFVQTYGLYYYKDEAAWAFMKDTLSVTNEDLLSRLILQHNDAAYDFSEVCKKSILAAILIESIENSQTLRDFMRGNNPNESHFIIYILYQIYLPLSSMREVFTHGDLHPSNIMLYMPSTSDKYLQYYYHVEGTVVEFKSPYVVKIIDYGSSFFSPKDGTISPQQYYRGLCKTAACGGPAACGRNNGFKQMNVQRKKYLGSYALERNSSQDLRLLYIVKNLLREMDIDMTSVVEFNHILRNLIFGLGVRDPQYGTVEYPFTGLIYDANRNIDFKNSNICNVMDAEKSLRELILKNSFLRDINDKEYSDPKKKLGDLHIYTDGRPMEFFYTV